MKNRKASAQILKFFSLLSFAGICFLLSVQPSLSELDKSYDENEKAVFAFHKLADKDPDFKMWIEESEGYKTETSMTLKQKYYEEESRRLQMAFDEFDHTNQYLGISTKILLQLRTDTTPPTLNFKFLNSGSSEIPYFPFPYGRQWVAVVIKDLGDFVRMGLNENQLEGMQKLFEPRRTYEATLNMQLRPFTADGGLPMSLDGQLQWLMMADIAFLEFRYSKSGLGDGKLLGNFYAAWNPNKPQ